MITSLCRGAAQCSAKSNCFLICHNASRRAPLKCVCEPSGGGAHTRIHRHTPPPPPTTTESTHPTTLHFPHRPRKRPTCAHSKSADTVLSMNNCACVDTDTLLNYGTWRVYHLVFPPRQGRKKMAHMHTHPHASVNIRPNVRRRQIHHLPTLSLPHRSSLSVLARPLSPS